MTGPEPRIPLAILDAMLVAGLRPHLAERAPPADLRWRLKQMQRQDWPTTMAEDPLLKRGYTMRQSLRVLGAMALLDAGLGPTLAVAMARDNEHSITAAMMAGVLSNAGGDEAVRWGLIRPGALAGPQEPDPSIILLRSATTLADDLRGEASGRALLVVDFGGIARRAVQRCRAIGPAEPLDQLDAVFAQSTREVRSGRGYVPGEAPTGDRYTSPRRAPKTSEEAGPPGAGALGTDGSASTAEDSQVSASDAAPRIPDRSTSAAPTK